MTDNSVTETTRRLADNLLADADEWWEHPSGSFVLELLLSSEERRTRVER